MGKTIEIDHYSVETFPFIDEILEIDGRKYKVIQNYFTRSIPFRYVTIAEEAECTSSFPTFTTSEILNEARLICDEDERFVVQDMKKFKKFCKQLAKKHPNMTLAWYADKALRWMLANRLSSLGAS